MEEIINQIGANWSKDLIIRFLYKELAPYFERDLLYFMVSDEEKEKQYQQGFINRFPKIVCSTLADFYVDLFKQFGINAKKVASNSAKIPLFAIIVEGDLGWYYIDPLSDLLANQYNLKPYFFGIIPRYNTIRITHPELIKLPPEYINELDNTLNFTYLDEYFQTLHQKLSQRKSAYEFFGFNPSTPIDLKEPKVQFYNSHLINLGHVNGPYERAQLYKYLNDRILNHSEKRHVCIRIEEWEQNPHISLRLENKEGNILYTEENNDGIYRLIKK